MRLVAFAVLATGCRTLLGFEPAELAEDASACSAWRPRAFDPCALGAPSPPLVLTGAQSPYLLDTGEGVLRDKNRVELALTTGIIAQVDGPELFTLFVEDLVIQGGARLEAIGQRPLMIASLGGIAIDGEIDVGSHRGEPDLGAGANGADCVLAMPGMIANSSGGSGGGGGGGNHGGGGDGGNGAGQSTGPGSGGRAATSTGQPTSVRGGCPGADSGAAGPAAQPPSSQSTVSRGGAGGGAIQLVARGAIQVPPAGRILAGGAGGAGAENGSICGGGGGGSGGFIGFEAESVTVRGIVAANGGGGGAPAQSMQSGVFGQDGQPSDLPARGGQIAPCLPGGDGAAGFNNVGMAGRDNAAGCGGGGGGGGTGWITIRAPITDVTGATISPPAVDLD